MNQDDMPRFATIVTGLCELYDRKLSKAAMSLYFEALKKYDIDTVSQGITAHVNSPDHGQFFPKPGDIVRMVSGTSKDAAFRAWTEVDKAVRTVGNYATVAFKDQIIMRVIQDMGGWIMLGEKEEREWPFVGKEFQERYNGYCSRGEIPEAQTKLIGKHEAENESRGFFVEHKVVQIGHTEQKQIGG